MMEGDKNDHDDVPHSTSNVSISNGESSSIIVDCFLSNGHTHESIDNLFSSITDGHTNESIDKLFGSIFDSIQENN